MLEIAISNNTTLQNKDIHVSVTDREVTLCGTVQSQKEKDEAEKISWTIPGVFIVNKELAILHG
jgi:osmotically-inducible protein OsmY